MKLLQWFKWLLLVSLIPALILSACTADDGLTGETGSEADAIAQSVRDYLSAQGTESEGFEIEVQEKLGGFARVQIISTDPTSPGGFTGFLQESDDGWTTLLVGSGFNPEEVQRLGIPQNILPEGWVLPAPLVDTGEDAICPEAANGSLAFANQSHGYCFLYPEGYTVEQPNPNETVLAIGSLMNHIDPRVSITVEPANGRTAAQAADESLAAFSLPAFEDHRSETAIGGVEAIMLDNMPGQDINRQVFAVHEGVLYHLFFTPFDPSLGEIYNKAEELFGMVTGSLVFQTPTITWPSEPFANLLADLAETGGAVQQTGEEVVQPFFTPAGRLVRLNGADLQVFEYESAEAAQLEVDLVAPDGGSIGTHMATWMASPHFFKMDRFIILFVGDDPAVLEMLESVFGSQFAGANHELAGWVTNANTSQQCGYAISYPPEMQVIDEGAYNRTFGFTVDSPGRGPLNFIYVSVIPPEARSLEAGSIYNYDPAETDILLNMQIGESKASRDVANVAQWFTYQRSADTLLGGHVAQTFVNAQPWEFPEGTKEIRHYVSLSDCTYLIGAYLDTTSSDQPGSISEELFNQIVATIRLTP